ncbi:Adenosine deaminase CECR1 [Armadillidium nasatum]|uniref:Adenosine deaminase CECR1 n=1 Tax=Armadillidium nasatum TaxID=96803 RepID=A0A5N5SMK0_9CRUS|nr:Adenosine deaminase CECR1 [Armadillidium nasatum]
MMLGFDLTLTEDEEKVNNILMTLKDEEMNKGFETLDFLAAKPFVESKESIDKSPVFFDTPDDSCKWALVAELRANSSSPQDFDECLFSKLSLYDPDLESLYPDLNSIWAAFQSIFGAMDGLLYEKSGKKYTEIESFQFYHNVIENFTSTHSDRFFNVRYIYGPPRKVSEAKAWYYVDLVSRLKEKFPSTIAGFDLVGQEDLGEPLTSFIDPFLSLAAHDPPIPFFFHAGETNWEGMPTDGNLYDAILLNSTRIGHGYAIAKHPKLLEMAREKDIAVEISPISNQVLRLVEDLRNHPGSFLAADSFPLVVSSDDPAIYSSLDDEEKSKYQSMWESQWNNFIQNQLKSSKKLPSSDEEKKST